MAIAGIFLTMRELAALQYLPHLAIAIYVRSLRMRMDFRTAMVGVFPDISWQAIAEDVYEEPHVGVKRGSTSRFSLIRASKWLERAGLIEMRTSERRLIFHLPMAHAGSLVPKKAAPKPHDQAARPLQREEAPQAARAIHSKAAQHRSVSTLLSTTTTNGELVGDSTAADAAARLRLEWSNRWTANMRAALSMQLQRAPTGTDYYLPQAILDELEGAMQQEEIRSPPNYLRRLVDKALQGEFQPAYGIAVAHARAKKTALSEGRRATVLTAEPPRPLTDEEDAALRRQFPKLRRSKEQKP